MSILYVRPEGRAEATEAGPRLSSSRDIEVCAGQAGCMARIEELSEGGGAVELVVIGPAVARPLSVARAVRTADPDVGLAVVTAEEDVESMRQKVSLSPGISDARIITAEGHDELRSQIRRAAEQLRHQQQMRSAVDEMNLELQRRRLNRRTAPSSRTVSDRHLSALTRYAPDAIISVNTSGSIASWNQAATEIFGYAPDQTEGAVLGDLLAPEGQTTLHETVRRAAEGSPQPPRDLDLRRRDGTAVTAAVTAAPVRNARDEAVGVVVMIRDVTEQRRTQEQLRHLQKAQSLATLAGGVAHDFNNLLVSVHGWAELALEEPDDPELARQALEQIRGSAGQAAALARQMLAYSGRTDLVLQTVDLNEIVEDMVGLLRSSISRKVDLETTLERPLPPVHADPTQLRQILMNLVTNAAEALGDDDGRIGLRTSSRPVDDGRQEDPGERDPADGLHVVLSVTDTGPGIDPEHIERVFEPFFTTKFTGRGLGLAASLGIAQAHGGTIEVESEPGAGTRFEVLLPAEPGTARSEDDPSGSV